MKKHIQTIHEAKKNHECKSCEQTFSQTSNLKAHVMKVHYENKTSLQCHLCDKYFSGNISLQAHLKRVHIDQKDFSCQLCKKAFLTERNLEAHISKMHSQIKNDRKKHTYHFDEKFRIQIIQNLIYYIKSFFYLLNK